MLLKELNNKKENQILKKQKLHYNYKIIKTKILFNKKITT